MKLISKVEDVFLIKGRGCVVVPGIPKSFSRVIKANEAIQLRKPDGSIIDTQLKAVEFIRTDKRRDHVAFVLPASLEKTDVPLGTEVWLVNEP